VDPVVGPVDGDERLAEIVQGRLAGGSHLSFGQHDSHPPRILQPADGMDPEGVVAKAPLGLLGHLDLGDEPAHRRIPARELDAGCFADQTVCPVAPDEILRPDGLAVGQLDVDATIILGECRHFTSPIDRYCQLGNPVGQEALDMVLPQPGHIVMPGGKISDVELGQVEVHDVIDLSSREESIGDSTLIEDLNGA
jgi:hypothetical protein